MRATQVFSVLLLLGVPAVPAMEEGASASRPQPEAISPEAILDRDRYPVLLVNDGEVQIASPDLAARFLVDDGFAPRWSPDGRTVAYARTDGIWTYDLTNGQRTQWTDGGSDPLWSPEGTSLLFHRDGAIHQLILAERRVRKLVPMDGRPAWIDEAGFLLEVNGNLVRFDLEDGSVHPVTGGCQAWDLAPSRKRIAFSREGADGESVDLSLCETDGGDEYKLIAINTWNRDVATLIDHVRWSPTGARLAYTLSYSDSVEIPGAKTTLPTWTSIIRAQEVITNEVDQVGRVTNVHQLEWANDRFLLVSRMKPAAYVSHRDTTTVVMPLRLRDLTPDVLTARNVGLENLENDEVLVIDTAEKTTVRWSGAELSVYNDFQ